MDNLPQTKVCIKCDKAKPLDEFHRNPRTSDGRQSSCKVCHKEYYRQWYKENKERRLGLARKWRQDNREHHNRLKRRWWRNNRDTAREMERNWCRNNPEKISAKDNRRRARKAEAPGDGVTSKQWEAILDFCGEKCLACGTTDDITMDHIVPLDMGGAHDVRNIQPLCRSCNASKGATETTDYRSESLRRFLTNIM